jgi:hypothetical protein
MCKCETTIEETIQNYIRKATGEFPFKPPTLAGLSCRWAVWASRRQVRRAVSLDMDTPF